ncbi:uncharacterized protein VTP21DRAFT_9556 [Calcarisporiella thermophila]|uniref:uncharacterized protein n=1 Tax=Calcarisporiella thermophila TaxID=911321 RepID=UPI0037433588
MVRSSPVQWGRISSTSLCKVGAQRPASWGPFGSKLDPFARPFCILSIQNFGCILYRVDDRAFFMKEHPRARPRYISSQGIRILLYRGAPMRSARRKTEMVQVQPSFPTN